VFYYLTVTNEPLPQPAMPAGEHIREGILKGLYRFRASQNKDAKLQAQLLGSGTIMYQVLQAQEILEKQYGVAADVWSVTSYKQLYRDGNDCDRWNLFHPAQPARVPYVTACLKDTGGVIVAASDYMKVLPESLAKWMPRALTALGTDGFGRSESRSALRDFFEVDAKFIVLATLSALAKDKKIQPEVVCKAIADLGINVDKPNPAVS
jgi:pyruvate dehydrogenase E1 component